MTVHPGSKWNLFSHSPPVYTVNCQQIFLCGLLKVGKTSREKIVFKNNLWKRIALKNVVAAWLHNRFNSYEIVLSESSFTHSLFKYSQARCWAWQGKSYGSERGGIVFVRNFMNGLRWSKLLGWGWEFCFGGFWLMAHPRHHHLQGSWWGCPICKPFDSHLWGGE